MTKPAPNPYRGNPLLGERPKRALTREDEHKRFLALFEHYEFQIPKTILTRQSSSPIALPEHSFRVSSPRGAAVLRRNGMHSSGL